MERLFRALGFSDSEVRVYVSLADLGGSTAGLLAKRLSIPRTTVYSALETLSGKGLVSSDEQGGVTRYLANPPTSLKRLVRDEREELERKEACADELVQLLGPFFRSRSLDVPRLQFFDGQKNVLTMLEEYLPVWRSSLASFDKIWWGYQDHTFVEQYRPWLDKTWATMEQDEYVYLVSNRAPIERELKGKVRGREIRTLADKSEFSSTIWILGHFIIMISSKEKPHYAFQIRDPVFAANLRSIFKALWERVEPSKAHERKGKPWSRKKA